MNIFPNLFLTNTVKCHNAAAPNKLTLLEPFVNENGKNDTFIYDGDYVISNRGYSNFVQLGYFANQSSGTLQSREPFKKKNFRFETYFSLENVQKGGNGFGFWVSSKLIPGGFYGRNKNFDGYGVVISTKGTPYLQFVNSKNQRSKKITIKDPQSPQSVIFENQHPNLKVYYKTNRDNKKMLLWSGQSNLEATFVLGASGNTGNSTTVFKVFSIFGSPIKGIEETFVASEQQKSSPVVMVIGIAAIVAIIYYLHSRQKKSNNLDN